MTYLNSLKADGIQPLLVDGGDWLFSLGRLHPNPLLQQQMHQKALLLVDAYNLFGTSPPPWENTIWHWASID